MKYRYPFMSNDDAVWVADDVRPAVHAVGGVIIVRDTLLFVVLPSDMLPVTIGRLGYFSYDQVTDDLGKAVAA